MNKKLVLFFLLISNQLSGQVSSSEQVIHLMGSRFEIIAIHDSKKIRERAIDESITEIQRIEALISSWKNDSETTLINQNSGLNPVKISEELFNLIARSKKVSELTNGAFDISFASIDPVWVFNGQEIESPDSAMVEASVAKINYQNIILDRTNLTVYLKKPEMKIGFGAIGKGYAANQAMNLMKGMGIENGMINAGGDLICWGNDQNGAPWKIGIADPSKQKDYIAWLNVSNMSVVTSGNYEKFVIIDGKKYGHIINPKTGYPVQGIQSVTVVCPDAELSDALATSVFVLGVKDGLVLINSLKNIECLIVDDDNKMWPSDKLELNYY